MRQALTPCVRRGDDDGLVAGGGGGWVHVAQAAQDMLRRFKFQVASVHNQREHVLMLGASILSGLPDDDVDFYDSWTGHRRGTLTNEQRRSASIQAAAGVGEAEDESYSRKQVDAAVRLLHRRTFESYKNWCCKMATVEDVGGGGPCILLAAFLTSCRAPCLQP
jgi:hypothetical protein